MKNIFVILLLLMSCFAPSQAFSKSKPVNKETPHYEVVCEYVRALSAVHMIQQTAEKEYQTTKNGDAQINDMMTTIRSCTRLKLELQTSIRMLKTMKLKSPFETLIPTTISIYSRKIKLYDEMINIAKNFLTPVPKSGVDYSKTAARIPEITAEIDYLDETILESMPLVFALLIDEKPDIEGHMSHINITTRQRQKLISTIDNFFGSSLNSKSKNFTVSSASVLKAYLQKDYKCIDEQQK